MRTVVVPSRGAELSDSFPLPCKHYTVAPAIVTTQILHGHVVVAQSPGHTCLAVLRMHEGSVGAMGAGSSGKLAPDTRCNIYARGQVQDAAQELAATAGAACSLTHTLASVAVVLLLLAPLTSDPLLPRCPFFTQQVTVLFMDIVGFTAMSKEVRWRGCAGSRQRVMQDVGRGICRKNAVGQARGSTTRVWNLQARCFCLGYEVTEMQASLLAHYHRLGSP